MSKASAEATMLELWRPPKDAGDPVGCLSTTYTFTPALFDEQCLARFLEIESEPDREDLAFLIEREHRLGGIYAGVMVDHANAGVEHSLRWDVIPIRLGTGRQHAKLSVLAWARHLRLIVSSANLTEPGYRGNFEVAASVDLSLECADHGPLDAAVAFLKALLDCVPGAPEESPVVRRAKRFLDSVKRKARVWRPISPRGTMSQKLVCTMPSRGGASGGRSSLDEAIAACQKAGRTPRSAWIASPFFDADEQDYPTAVSLCVKLRPAERREVGLCLPAVRDDANAASIRIAAPKSLFAATSRLCANTFVRCLPEMDADKNRRPWHAKMMAFYADAYEALMIGSSNFTRAGMGIGRNRNAEANLLTIAKRAPFGRERGQLDSIWPDMDDVEEPDSAEWLGALPQREEEEQEAAVILPAGFLSATYRAGDERKVVLRLAPGQLPAEWSVNACGREIECLLSAEQWRQNGSPKIAENVWTPLHPPEKLLVRWAASEAFLPLNVEDADRLPPPSRLESMSADDMLRILAASDPSAAFRSWAQRQGALDGFDGEIDSATPIDLDPLRRYALQETFLHRVRNRARVFAQLRANLQQPVGSLHALEWRLRGIIGVEQLAERLLSELKSDGRLADEALLSLADLLIVLKEVQYEPAAGFVTRPQHDAVYRPFLRDLSRRLGKEVQAMDGIVSAEVIGFWNRVEASCRK